MRYTKIKNHLEPFSIVAKGASAIRHAFAAAIAPCDAYDERTVRKAVAQLGQDPDNALRCAYCGSLAQTWDHINAPVRKKVFSGYGHRLGNLVPCCKSCNLKKVNKTWRAHLHSLPLDRAEIARRESLIENYTAQRLYVDQALETQPEYGELIQLKDQVLDLLRQADIVATRLREKSTKSLSGGA